MIYFTSDLHLGHKNIIKHCNRPFQNSYEMDKTIMHNWNSKVDASDTIYVLGDVSFHSKEKTIELLKLLNGEKHLILGNHDRKLKKEVLDLFSSVKDLSEIQVPDEDAFEKKQRITLCHYAMRTWNKSHFGTWHLYGHSHGSLTESGGLSFDVGVDCHDFFPISYDEVKEIMKRKKFAPVDHHDEYTRR